MSKCPFLFEGLSSAFMRSFTEEIGENTRRFREQYLSPTNVLKFKHGQTWDSPANELGDKSGDFKRHSVETQIKLADIAAGRVEVIFEQISEVSESLHSQLQGILIDTISRSTEQSGQIVSAGGRAMPEAMYEMLEKMHLPLDDDGELSMPSMFIHPSQSKTIFSQLNAAGPEFEARFEELKLRKKEEAQLREVERLRKFERPSE